MSSEVDKWFTHGIKPTGKSEEILSDRPSSHLHLFQSRQTRRLRNSTDALHYSFGRLFHLAERLAHPSGGDRQCDTKSEIVKKEAVCSFILSKRGRKLDEICSKFVGERK